MCENKRKLKKIRINFFFLSLTVSSCGQTNTEEGSLTQRKTNGRRAIRTECSELDKIFEKNKAFSEVIRHQNGRDLCFKTVGFHSDVNQEGLRFVLWLEL